MVTAMSIEVKLKRKIESEERLIERFDLLIQDVNEIKKVMSKQREH